MLFALSLLFVFAILGLMIYRSDLFHATSDHDFSYKEDFNKTEKDSKKIFFHSDRFKNTSNEDILEKTK